MYQECQCPYCKQVGGFPVLWEIYDRDNCYWYEIPKNGSMTIKTAYKGRKRIEGEEKLTLVGKTKPVMIYRNPYERYVSLFKHYFTKKGGRYSNGTAFLKQLDYDYSNKGVNQIFDFVLDNLDKLDSQIEVHHFYPQVRFIEQDLFDDLEFIKLSELSKKWEVNNLHHTEYDGNIDLSFEHRKRLAEIYREDFQFFSIRGLDIN